LQSPTKFISTPYELAADLLLDLIKNQNRHPQHPDREDHVPLSGELSHKLYSLTGHLGSRSGIFIYNMPASSSTSSRKCSLPPYPLAGPRNWKTRAPILCIAWSNTKNCKSAAQFPHHASQIEEHVWSKPDLSLYQWRKVERRADRFSVDLVQVFLPAVRERRREVGEDRATTTNQSRVP